MKKTFLDIYDILFFRAESIVKDKDDAYDILQDLFVIIDKREGQYDKIPNKRGYLYGMVSKKALEFLRTRKRHAEIEKSITIEVFHEDSDHSLDIDEMLSRLTDLQRQIVKMHDIEGFSCFEIAIKITRTPVAVKKQLALAHKKLKEYYKNGF